MTRRPELLERAERSAYELEEAARRREVAIRAAFAGGYTTREIAAAVGLSHARVWQLCRYGSAALYPPPRRSLR